VASNLAEVFRRAAGGEAARPLPGDVGVSGRLSLRDLLSLHEDDSAAATLLLLALLCGVPVAGLGTVLAFALFAVAYRWRKGPGAGPLWPRLACITLTEAWSKRCLQALAWLYATADRCLRARWTLMCHSTTSLWWSAWIALMALLILLPLPLGNVLPSLSLVLLGLGWMFRDGLAMLLATVVGAAAVGFAVLMTDLIVAGLVQGARWVAGLV
jgi:hypothetical protein